MIYLTFLKTSSSKSENVPGIIYLFSLCNPLSAGILLQQLVQTCSNVSNLVDPVFCSLISPTSGNLYRRRCQTNIFGYNRNRPCMNYFMLIAYWCRSIKQGKMITTTVYIRTCYRNKTGTSIVKAVIAIVKCFIHYNVR